MFNNPAAEYRLLACAIDKPDLIRSWRADLFTDTRRNLFNAMKQAYERHHGEISTEGIEQYMRPIPPELEAARGAKPSALIDQLKDLATRRQLLEIADTINTRLQSGNEIPRTELVSLLEVAPVLTSEDSSLVGGINAFTADLRMKRAGRYQFIDTGLPFLNYMLGNEWPRQACTVIMGKGGGGKTALISNSMLNMARKGIPSLFVSLEMRKDKLVSRFVANMANVNGILLRQGKVTEEEIERINEALAEIQQLPIYIIDSPHLTVNDIVYEVKRHKEHHDIQAFFIDYLQIINEDTDSDWESLGHLTQQIRNVAVDTDTAAIVLSQQNRDTQKKGLDSLLGSSRIGHIADTVIEIGLDETISDTSRLCKFNFVKNREGPLGESNGIYRPNYLRFE
jgi:replicative DNA helicase